MDQIFQVPKVQVKHVQQREIAKITRVVNHIVLCGNE